MIWKLAIPKYNEVKYAELILANGFQTQYYKYELKVLVKYWKSIGIKPKQRKQMLYEFCQKNIAGFEREIHYKMINSVMAYSSKKTSVPIVIKSIPIYKHEFEILNNLPVQEYQKKIMFAILVEKKIKKQISNIMNGINEVELSPFININSKLGRKLVQSARIPSKHKMDRVLYELNQLGHISVMDRELIKLDYFDFLVTDNDPEVLIEVKTFDESGYYFDLLSGDKKIGFCEDCGEIIKRRANNQIRCKECNEVYRRDYKTENKRKERLKCRHSETVV